MAKTLQQAKSSKKMFLSTFAGPPAPTWPKVMTKMYSKHFARVSPFIAPPEVRVIFFCCGRWCRKSSLEIILREFFGRPAPPLWTSKVPFSAWSYNFHILGLQNEHFALVFGAVGPERPDRANIAQMQRGDQKRVWKILRAFGSVFSAGTTPCGGPRNVFQTTAFKRLVPNNSLPRPSRAFSGHSPFHSQCLRHRMLVAHNDAASLQPVTYAPPKQENRRK